MATSSATGPDTDSASRPGGWTVAQACRAAGVTRKAIRVYEGRGLIDPPPRSAAGYRLFADDEVERLRFIRRARGLGMGLEDIAALLAEHDAGRSPCASVRAQLDRRIGEIDRAVTELLALRAGLVDAAGRCATSAPEPPAEAAGGNVICPVIDDPTDRIRGGTGPG